MGIPLPVHVMDTYYMVFLSEINKYYSAFSANFSLVVRPPYLALGGAQLPLPVLQ